MKYTAIGFDYGGVIGGVDDGSGTTGASFQTTVCGLLDITADQYLQCYFSINHLMMLGEIETWEEFWKIFLAKLGVHQDMLPKLMSLNSHYEEALKVIDERELALVDRLRQAGYCVGLLSNASLQSARNMRKAGIDTHFDVFFASCERKMMKPQPAAFRAFAADLGVRLEDMLFIDDNEKSLSTAEECGFRPVLFVSYEKLVAELHDLGVI